MVTKLLVYVKLGVSVRTYVTSSTIFFWINDDSNDIKNIEIFLKNQIKKTSSIKEIKNFFINNFNRVPNIINFRKVFKKPS